MGFYVLLIAIMIAVIFTMTGNSDTKKLKNYSDLVDLFQKEKVKSFTTEGNTIILQVRTDSGEPPTEEMTYDLMSFNVFYNDFNETIKEIALELNFPNQSFLGKFFREHVGISPLRYRRQ